MVRKTRFAHGSEDSDTVNKDTVNKDEEGIRIQTVERIGISMKKALVITILLSMLLLLCACSKIDISSSEETSDTQQTVVSTAGSTPTQTADQAENDLLEATPDNNETEEPVKETSAPIVFFTSDISAEGLISIYEALGWQPTGTLAVKVSTGEPPSSNYLRQELIGELIQSLNGTYVECMTAYGGQRSSIAMAKQVAADHGFSPFVLLDENGSMTLPVKTYNRISENYVGAGMANYDSMLVLSHFKGHAMAGFGGAIKNISIGLGSKEGKSWIHSGGTSKTNIWGGDQTAFTESMAEAASSVADYYGDRIIYINVMNRLSVDCDCDGHPAEPDIHDIGILASTDPVALDQACYDLVAQAEGNAALMNRIERQHGLHTLEHGEKIGLGSRTYTLINIDE